MFLGGIMTILDPLDEVICIGRHKNKAIFVDEDGDLACVDDPDNVLEVGQHNTAYASLIPFSQLTVEEQKDVVKAIFK